MSPPQQTQHIYIPNLQGLQILQITPSTDDDEEACSPYTSSNPTPTNTPVSYTFTIPDDAF
ncbi:hypothetical protein Vi05172_g6002 [Venturia inaequalis]|nr:hypothetical protein Vi05172_g6002 [Venturia inaequalis]